MRSSSPPSTYENARTRGQHAPRFSLLLKGGLGGLALLISGLIISPPAAAFQTDKADRYQRCIAQISYNAKAAMEAALAWRTESDDAPARHCLALALFAMGHAKEAALEFEKVATMRGTHDDNLRADILDQAGNAWIVAGDGARALADLEAAIELANLAQLPARTKALYQLDRARALMLLGQNTKARSALDSSIAQKPTPVAYTLRARIKREARDFSAASADIRWALKLDKDYAEAYFERGKMRLQQADSAAARDDFLQAALLSEADSPLQRAAQREIEKLAFNNRPAESATSP